MDWGGGGGGLLERLCNTRYIGRVNSGLPMFVVTSTGLGNIFILLGVPQDFYQCHTIQNHSRAILSCSVQNLFHF